MLQKQTVAEAVAAEDRAREAYGATVDGQHTAIVRLQNELADAQFDLDQTVVRAPAGGFVTQVSLRPGMYVVPLPLRPAMIFVNDSQRDRALVAAFQQNALQRVKPGNEAEVLFKGVPGRVFKAKVRCVATYTYRQDAHVVAGRHICRDRHRHRGRSDQRACRNWMTKRGQPLTHASISAIYAF
jgi:multidrug resistance efflux pump